MLSSEVETDLQKNANRFKGFSDDYESARPVLPSYPTEIIIRYLGRRPETVVDLGCGTGLSTMIWANYSRQVIGVEPSQDMLAVALRKHNEQISFVQGSGQHTGLENQCADVVICSQSFHWMEPTETLKEVNRILKPGGLFATIDYDWPPVSLWPADEAFEELSARIKTIESTVPEIQAAFVRYPKEEHLANIRNSRFFRYARELLFANREYSGSERFFNLALSLGSLRMILKKQPDLIASDLQHYKEIVEDTFAGRTFPVDFCYRMRLAVK